MTAEMRGPTPGGGGGAGGGGRPGINRRVSSVFDMGSGSRGATPAISSPPRRASSGRQALVSTASFSVGSGSGSAGAGACRGDW